jgi:N6-adenosine-specific RNA methylase IME4
VRVVNTSGTSGLARRATQHLREYGFDVVDFTTGRTDNAADTRIAVHTGHPEWAAHLKKALGVGTVGTDADTSRYVDLTVFLGRDWRPPAESLRP